MSRKSKSVTGQQHQGGGLGCVSYKSFTGSRGKKREKLLATEEIQKGKAEKNRKLAESGALR